MGSSSLLSLSEDDSCFLGAGLAGVDFDCAGFPTACFTSGFLDFGLSSSLSSDEDSCFLAATLAGAALTVGFLASSSLSSLSDDSCFLVATF